LKGKTLPLINADNTDRENQEHLAISRNPKPVNHKGHEETQRETFTKEGTDNRRHLKGKALPLINADNERLASAT
jgi:hypothetical protein